MSGRVIVGGIGYRNLRDHSLGVEVAECLMGRPWPEGVVVEDLSYGPIAVVQRFEDEPPDQRFARAVLVAGVAREGRRPGTVVSYRWDGALPPEDEVQRAVTEAVTGVIFLDNTLIVCRQFGALPEEVVVVEVEPAVHEFGDTFSPAVDGVFAAVCELVTRLATDAGIVDGLPRMPLGGGLRARAEVG